jgi:uncharacterized protein YkwD
MARLGCFSHQCPGEPPFDVRVSNSGYIWSTVGENIGAGYTTAADIVAGWMASPGHRANLLGSFRDLGIARLDCSACLGPLWTADFASP